jgi:acyl-CoA thioesterase I
MRLLFLLLISFCAQAQTILFLGDSLTEGYQLSKEEAFPAVVERELKKSRPAVKVINGGVAGATSASGLKRLDWYLKAKPDVMVLALGANDGLRGLTAQELERNLTSVIEKAQGMKIRVILAGMKMPTNMGPEYRKKYEDVFPRVAKRFELTFIPFLLEGVGGVSSLNLPDGIHPNAKGYEVIAKHILKVLVPVL